MNNDRIRRFARAAGVALVAVLAPGLLASCAADGVMQPRVETLEAKEEVRSTLLDLSSIIDAGDASQLKQLSQRVDPQFTLRVTNPQGQQQQYSGLDEATQAFQQMVSAESDVAPSAISVDVQGNTATAKMTLISASNAPQQMDQSARYLMLSDVRATFTRQGPQQQWRLQSIDIVQDNSLAGTQPPGN